MKCKIIINDKNYTSYDYFQADTFKKIKLDDNLNPINFKLFSEDIFEYNGENNKINIIHSVVRCQKNLAGVLIMNKSFGRKGENKIYYKCIPHDKRIPDFLVPLSIKQITNNSFNKTILNKYITFYFINWNNKHPEGCINQIIGNTNDLFNFFEYQLYSKYLNFSLSKFSKDINAIFKNSSKINIIEEIISKFPNIEKRDKEYIFSIDPENCQDIDDALSITELDNKKIKVSIYISNVMIVLDYLNLWTSFSERVSTIYLPDRKRPMLPNILSDNLCSLKEETDRFAIVLDLIFINEKLISNNFKNVVINIKKNLSYKEANEKKNTNYNFLLNFTKKICKNYKFLSDIGDSHDLVSYYMLFMNNMTCCFQETFKNGIYRSVSESSSIDLPSNLPNDISSFFKIFHGMSGLYTNYNERTVHMYINDKSSSYLHITSPIRRIVDLLNLIKFQENLKEIDLSESSKQFYDSWLERLEYINTSMRSIKKVQNNCNLLYICNKDENLLSKVFKGYIFDKIIRDDGLYQYSVYIKDMNIVSKIIVNKCYENYSEYNFKLYMFLGENEIKKKIRLELIG